MDNQAASQAAATKILTKEELEAQIRETLNAMSPEERKAEYIQINRESDELKLAMAATTKNLVNSRRDAATIGALVQAYMAKATRPFMETFCSKYLAFLEQSSTLISDESYVTLLRGVSEQHLETLNRAVSNAEDFGCDITRIKKKAEVFGQLMAAWKEAEEFTWDMEEPKGLLGAIICPTTAEKVARCLVCQLPKFLCDPTSNCSGEQVKE